MRIGGIDAAADLIDRLIVETNKLAWLEEKKRIIQGQTNRDPELIAQLDDKSRNCCEFRTQIKNRINELFSEIVSSQEYKALSQVRTFRQPTQRLSELLADRCYEVALECVTGELAQSLEKEFLGET